MNKVEEIFKAWNIAFKPDNQQAELASKRIEICNSCEHKVTNLGINRCSVCGCALKGKVFSPVVGACPKGKWDDIDQVMIKKSVEITSEDTIFVQIASYRDPQLLSTLDDLFNKAAHPENLHIAISWQHSLEDSWDTLEKYKNDTRVTIIDIPYMESKGVCWARNLVQQEYRGEKYTLQLDSHHRFAENWDTTLIQMLKDLQEDGYAKPLITAYIPSFDPDDDPNSRVQIPWKMNFDRFTPEGVVFFIPASIDDFQDRTKPVPSRFYSAHFAFSIGEFAIEVQHDPTFYFHGEEITIAVRAFTHGYDLFHPHVVVAWHEYTRKGRTKHWDDSKEWVATNTFTHKRTRQLLGIDGEQRTDDFGIYGLGKVRSIEEYEKFAGIRFKDRGVQEYTTQYNYPPNPIPEDYDNSFHTIFRHCIDLHINSVPETDYEFWVVAFHDENGLDTYRKDCDKQEVESLIASSKNKDGWINIWRSYVGPVPHKAIIWPYSTSKGWCERIDIVLPK